MNSRKFYSYCIAAVIGATFALPGGSALAQQAGDSALEEIIVVARKREENLQDVGMSVSAFGKQEIENKYSTDVRDLVSISPNLVIDDTAQGPGGVASIYIRGIGVSEVEKNFDPAVGVVMDGIYIGTMTGGLQRTIDLERVEVLRGPQGTLFGRNTIGGVINMERTRPTMELGGTVRLGYEDYDTTVLEGIFNFPLGDQVGVKLTGAYRDQAEGYYTSTCTPGVPVSSVTPPCTTNGQDIGQIEYTNYGINLLWAANDNLEFEYTYDREETTQDTPTLVNASQNNVPPLDNSFCDNFTIPAPTTAFCAPSLTTPTSGDRLNTDVVLIGPQNTFPNGPGWGQGTVPTQRLLGSGPPQEPARDATFDTETHIVEARWDFAGDYRMDFIAGTWETEETVLTDWDATSEVRFHTDRPAEYEQTTAELRFSSTSDGPINWTAGAYWWDSEYEIRLVSILGFFFLPPPGPVPFVTRIEAFGLEPLDLPQFSKQTSESRAVFGEVDWDINDRWTLTVGGRWTEDEKTTNQSGQVPCGIEPLFGPFLPPGEVVTPAPYDELCFGPGGLAANPTADPAIGGDTNTPVTAEHDWSEFTPRVGLKWAISDDSMAYFTYSTGYRAGGFNGRVDSVESASQPYNQETVDNFEIGYKSQWLDNRLRFNAAIFYMEYEDKQEEVQQTSNTSGTGQRTFALNASDATVSGLEMELLWIPAERWQIRANLGFLDTEYDNFAIDTTGDGMFDTDFSHLDFRRAPDFTGSLSADYQWPLGPGQMWISGTWHYIGEHEVDFANKPELSNDAQSLVSAAINYEYKNALFSVFGHNLLDEDGYTIGFDVAGLWSRAPRTVGAQVVFRFGE
jgi:iron complex outermembrane receptor protein